jgi:rhomboid protease GluP
MARAILCPRCRQLIGSEESVCSWCGTSRSAPFWKILNWTKLTTGGDSVVKAVITVNILYYAVSLLLGMSGGLLSPSQGSMMLLGATGTVPINYYHGGAWTLITASYLHGGIMHLLFNLAALYQLGPWVVNEYGAARMFTIYTLGGVCGYLLSYAAGIPFTIGASAAVCGLAGSLLYYGKSRGGSYGSAVYQQLSGWVISIFIFGLLFPGINNWAHGGGIIGGALLGMLLGYTEKSRENLFHRILALLCVAVTLAALCRALLQLI